MNIDSKTTNKYLISNHNGFKPGLTQILSRHTTADNMQMDFSILKLKAGETYTLNKTSNIRERLEHACLLMSGHASLCIEDSENKLERNHTRNSLFDENPFVANIGINSTLSIKAETVVELALIATENPTELQPTFYDHTNMMESERRGYGILNNTSYRTVRTVFDQRNNKDSNLVIGEVITFPGCWSSYPPHFHPQPEFYHYRFTESQGYGHSELDDNILKIQNHDTLKILDNKTHAQVAAPGYGMYYIWVIRNLPNNPYTIPDFVKDHEWTKTTDANKKVWIPQEN